MCTDISASNLLIAPQNGHNSIHTKGWFNEFDTNVISVFDIFTCNFGKNWATETCFTSNEQLKPFLFG